MSHEPNERRERFYDLCYDAWRSGRNPDDVSEERFETMLDHGYAPDEIGLRDVLPGRREDHDGDNA